MDHDDVFDEVVGSLMFDLQDIVDGKYAGKFLWRNIYGSPVSNSLHDGYVKEHKTEMNENPEAASNWKGRVLVQVECEATEKPVAKVVQVEDEIIMMAKEFTLNRKYQIIAEVGQGVALPKKEKYSVKLVIGGVVFETGKAKV